MSEHEFVTYKTGVVIDPDTGEDITETPRGKKITEQRQRLLRAELIKMTGKTAC